LNGNTGTFPTKNVEKIIFHGLGGDDRFARAYGTTDAKEN